MSTPDSNSHVFEAPDAQADVTQQIRDISEVPAIEVITTAAVHLMSAAAVKLGLAAEDNAEELKDLDEARKLITALAGLVTSAAPEIGSQHAGRCATACAPCSWRSAKSRSSRTPRARARAKSSRAQSTEPRTPSIKRDDGGRPRGPPAVVVPAPQDVRACGRASGLVPPLTA